jgi:hypothetical protein
MKKIFLTFMLILGLASIKAQTDVTYSEVLDFSVYDSLTVVYVDYQGNEEELYTIVNNDSIEYNFINDSLSSTWVIVGDYNYFFNAEGEMKYYTRTDGNTKYCKFFDESIYTEFIYFPSVCIDDLNTGYGGLIGSGSSTHVGTNHEGSYSINVDNEVGTGVKWRFLSGKACTAEIKIRYSSNEDRPGELYLNGEIIDTLAFASTGSFSTWDYETFELDLHKDINIIKLIGINSASMGLVDNITIKLPDGSTVTPFREYDDPVAYAHNSTELEGYVADGVDSVFVQSNISSDLYFAGSGSTGDYINIVPGEYNDEGETWLNGIINITGDYVKLSGVTLYGKIVIE